MDSTDDYDILEWFFSYFMMTWWWLILLNLIGLFPLAFILFVIDLILSLPYWKKSIDAPSYLTARLYILLGIVK